MDHPTLIIGLFRITAITCLGAFVIFSTGTILPYALSVPAGRPGCDAPIHYRIENVDPQFPLDTRAFRSTVFEAETLWERGVGKDLFVYDPGAPFVVRTEFDARQKMTAEASGLKQKISEYESTSKAIKETYDAAVARYEKENSSFKATADAFNKKLAAYNSDVKDWNASGSGTADEYESLEKRRKKIENEEKELAATSNRINALADEVNALAGKLNRATADINGNISTFRTRYGEPRPFVQGLYDSGIPSITIFQFEDRGDLRLVLAHEFGHALGIDHHVESASSLMFHLMGGQNIEHPSLSEGDLAAYSAACPQRETSKSQRLIRYLVLTPWDSMDAETVIGLLSGK